MLVLSRKVGERILIGDQVAITVVRINATTVRLGIDAPSKMVVVREELATGAGEQAEAKARPAPTVAS
jgi:carbon storage regulator